MNSKLVIINKSSFEKVSGTTTSNIVADVFGKEHKNVLRDIENLKEKVTNDFFYMNFKENTYKSRGKHYKSYNINKEGFGLLIKNYRNIDKEKAKKLLKDLNISDFKIQVFNRFETEFLSMLTEQLDVLDVYYETQKIVYNYRIDLYIPIIKLAIEYDEKQHKYNKKKDKKREEFIIKELNCKFIRLDYKNTDSYNCAMIIKELIKEGAFNE